MNAMIYSSRQSVSRNGPGIIRNQYMPIKFIRRVKIRAWCKKENIRLSGPKLGRPIEDIEVLKTQKKQQRQDEIDRIEIEGKFGVGNRRFSLDRIMMKLRATSEHSAALIFMMINLNKILRDLLLSIFKMLMEKLFVRIFCFNRLKMVF